MKRFIMAMALCLMCAVSFSQDLLSFKLGDIRLSSKPFIVCSAITRTEVCLITGVDFGSVLSVKDLEKHFAQNYDTIVINSHIFEIFDTLAVYDGRSVWYKYNGYLVLFEEGGIFVSTEELLNLGIKEYTDSTQEKINKEKEEKKRLLNSL